jgi:hypothetical protein
VRVQLRRPAGKDHGAVARCVLFGFVAHCAARSLSRVVPGCVIRPAAG